jgi:hypothetical protein
VGFDASVNGMTSMPLVRNRANSYGDDNSLKVKTFQNNSKMEGVGLGVQSSACSQL